MKTYRNFNPVEFNSYVKFVKETVKHVFSNTKSKNVICQAAKDYNYNVEDVYQYLHEITKETYPEYMMKLNNRNWRKIYDSYMFDEELAPRLQEILDCTEGKEDDNFYRDSFFQVIKDMGVNPEIMKIDMALDTFGWLWTLLLIVKKAEENPFTGEFAVKIRVETETSKCKKTTVEKSSKGETPVKGRGKSVVQYTKDDVLVRIYSSVKEAVEVLSSGTGKDCKNANVYQALREGGSAYGYKWRYQEVSVSGTPETTTKEVLHVEEPVVATGKVIKEKLDKTGVKVSEMLVAYYMDKNKEIDRTKEIGRFISQQDACNSLRINKGVLSNYLKGRKDSVFYNTEDGQKVRIGFERVAA